MSCRSYWILFSIFQAISIATSCNTIFRTSTLCATVTLGATVAGQMDDRDDETAWVSHPQPGVTLIGRKNEWAKYDLGYRSAVSPDGKHLIGFQSKDLVVLDRETMKEIERVPLPINSVMQIKFSHDGSRLVVIGYNVVVGSSDKEPVRNTN